MIEPKTCWTCKYREINISIKPCNGCDLHFKWEPRDNA